MGILTPRSLRQSIILLDSVETDTDIYGNAVYEDVSSGTYPASVSVADQSENESGRDTFTATYTFIVEARCPVEGVDSVSWGGSRYEVVGNPKSHMLPNGTVHHKEFQGRLHSG